MADGRNSYCKECSMEAARASKAAKPEKYAEMRRSHRLRTKFGMTPEDYDRLLRSQGGVCALCGRPPKSRRLAVDHCHGTGRVRGLLCNRCNTALGTLGDSVEQLERVLSYLEGVGA